MLIKSLRRLFFSLLRFGNNHGFGVQSPFAYRFITNVARESLPYYSYETLLKKFPENDYHSLALHRFLFRFSNYMQDKPWSLSDADDVDKQYIHAACKHSGFTDVSELGHCPIIFKDMKAFESMKKQYPASVFFDLFDCGVVFFDPSLQQGSYKCVLKV